MNLTAANAVHLSRLNHSLLISLTPSLYLALLISPESLHHLSLCSNSHLPPLPRSAQPVLSHLLELIFPQLIALQSKYTFVKQRQTKIIKGKAL